MITEGRTTSATKTDALQHPMFARFYMRLAGLAERLGRQSIGPGCWPG